MLFLKKFSLSLHRFLYPLYHLVSIEGIVSNTRGKNKSDQGSIWDFLAGLGMGIIGYTILAELVKPKCPKCGNSIERGISSCAKCDTELEWK